MPAHDGAQSGWRIRGFGKYEHDSATFETTRAGWRYPPGKHYRRDTWTQSFTIEGTQTVGDRDVASKNHTEYNCTAGATKSVTVPAGTFDAVRVDCTTVTEITITMSGQDIPSSVNSTSTTWYAPGVGMVKTDASTDGSPNTIELTAYNIP